MNDQMSAYQTKKPKMLVVDSAYSYKMMLDRGLFGLVTGRDLNGYFDHVWTVHPVASLFEAKEADRCGDPVYREIAPRHTHVEGRVGRFRFLRRFQILNFLLAQAALIRSLLRLARAEGINIVRAEDALYNGLLALLLSKLRGLPLVIGIWGNPDKGRQQSRKPLMPRLFRRIWIEEAVETFVLRRANLVVVQSADEVHYVIGKGVSPSNVKIFMMTNALEDVHWREPKDRDDGLADIRQLGITDEVTFLCISRLLKIKLVDHALLVVHLLKERGRKVKLILAGEGEDQPNLHALAEKLGISSQIIFAGNRSQAWLGRVIPAVSAVLSPYTGRALAEAALGAAPTVAYDVDWHSEFIETGVTGELVPYLDHVAMADAAERLIVDRGYARTMGDNLRTRALKHLDRDSADRDQRSAYAGLLGHRALQ